MRLDLTERLQDEELIALARERAGFYKGRPGFYLTVRPEDDLHLLRYCFNKFDIERDIGKVGFKVQELGSKGCELLDLAVVQMENVIAGPFESREKARSVCPYVAHERYINREFDRIAIFGRSQDSF